ncbi:MAG: hypothetical protein KJ064_19275 [Anaerolineae bacterium]|nr:hypothetical protein [Anaerolineae bacterium]
MRGFVLILMGFIAAYGCSLSAVYSARFMGALTPIPPNYLDPGDCVLPCWYGVRPGEEAILIFEERLALANRDGAWMFSGRTWNYGGQILAGFRLNITPTRQLRLGDAILVYGEPQYAFLASSASTLGGRGPRRVVTEAYIYWQEGGILVNAVQPDGSFRITPDMPIRAIEMRQPPKENEDPVVPLGTPRWHGFGSAEYYRLRQ